ncbi:MAG: AbrB/MazE/SpoVT family DNA-binding domain-containing protein [Spirochaetota bacterium]
MQATIQRWGNSLGIRIPGHMAKELALKNGSSVEILEDGENIIIKPSKKPNLEDLLALVTDENIHEEEFALPAGREAL